MKKEKDVFTLLIIILILINCSVSVSYALLPPKPKIKLTVAPDSSTMSSLLFVGGIGIVTVEVWNSESLIAGPASNVSAVLTINNAKFINPSKGVGNKDDFNKCDVNDHSITLTYDSEVQEGQKLVAFIGFIPQGPGIVSIIGKVKMYSKMGTVEATTKVSVTAKPMSDYYGSLSDYLNHKSFARIAKARRTLLLQFKKILDDIHNNRSDFSEEVFTKAMVFSRCVLLELSKQVAQDLVGEGLINLAIANGYQSAYFIDALNQAKSAYDIGIGGNNPIGKAIMSVFDFLEDSLDNMKTNSFTESVYWWLIESQSNNGLLTKLIDEISSEEKYWATGNIDRLNKILAAEENVLRRIVEFDDDLSWEFCIECQSYNNNLNNLSDLAKCAKNLNIYDFAAFLEALNTELSKQLDYIEKIKTFIIDCDHDGILDFEDIDTTSCVSYEFISKPPESITLGDSFYIDVVAKNSKGKDAVAGGITYSFPMLNRVGDHKQVENLYSSNGEYHYREKGDNIYHSNGKWGPAEYLLVENWKEFTWKNNNELELKVKVTPKGVGKFVSNVRFVIEFNSNNGRIVENYPVFAFNKDQQGWYVYSFTTMVNPPNHSPDDPTLLYPSNRASNVPLNINLKWTGGDRDNGDIVTYSIYLKSESEGDYTKVCETMGYECNVSLRKGTRYYWYVKATDSKGAKATSSVWSFVTEVPRYSLQILKQGSGSGTVTSSPSGINCGSTCSHAFNEDTSVTLTATASSGSVFQEWGGACSSCGSSTTCTITMDSDKSCTAIFNKQLGNQAPIIDSFRANPISGKPPLKVTFTCTAHDPDGSITSYKWDFDGDGNTDKTTVNGTIDYTYTKPGTYQAEITVVDDKGATASSKTTVKVSQKQGYLLHYTFDSCNATDFSNNGINGQIQGSPQCVAGVSGKALNFDGKQDWIKVDKLFGFKDFTVSMWFKTTNNDVQGILQTTDGHAHGLEGMGIAMLNGNDLEIDYRAARYGDKCEIHAKNMNLADGKWHLLTLVRNTSERRGYLYIDGKLAGSCQDPAPNQDIPSQSYMRIAQGYYCTRGYSYFKGAMDDIRIYNYALSNKEIHNIYDNIISSSSIVKNGDFSNGLENWTFKDLSLSRGICSGARSEVKIQDGEAVIHAHSSHGEGMIYQSFGAVKPKKLMVKYKASSSSGHCNGVWIYFYGTDGNKIAGFTYTEDSFVPRYSVLNVNLLGQDYRLEHNRKYSSGYIEFVFEWDNSKLTAKWHSLDGAVETLKSVDLLDEVKVSKVELHTGNGCCDGRNDAYGYFDDVKIEAAEAGSIVRNRGNLNGDGKIDLKDAIIALKVAAGLSVNQSIYLDSEPTGDGKIGLDDAIFILRKLAQE